MNNQFKKLADEIKFDITPAFNKVSLVGAKLENGKIFNLEFEAEELIPASDMTRFLNALNSNFKYKTKLQFTVSSVIFNSEIIKNYLTMIFERILVKPHIAASISNAKVLIDDVNVSLEFQDSLSHSHAIVFQNDINRIMGKFGFERFNSTFSVVEHDDSILHNERTNIAEQAKMVLAKKSEAPKEETVIKRKNVYEKVKISDLAEGVSNKVIVSGEIFDTDVKTTKTDLEIISLSITDLTDAIYVKMFARTEEQKSEFRKFKKGMYIEVSGDYQIDTYSKEPVIIARKIRESEVDSDIRKDNAMVKRVELGARTRMSTMDGVVNASDLVKRAKAWNHKAIAIVDQDSVQSYPDLFYATKGTDIKPIYGVSLSTIDEENGSVYWPKNNNLLEDSYVVFDLETTGLSPEYEDIIEFGATKVINGVVAESKQFFVKPTKPIPEIITEITSITNNDVANAKPESEAIKDIRDYLSGHTIVAHNANFDITFVNAKLIKYGFEPLFEPTIDSMIVARITQPNAKRFRLENVASRYQITYDSTVAHRADYDADVLARVWIRMINDLKEMNILTQMDLINYSTPDLHARKFTKEVTMIAKNQNGLKELFKYVSTGLTEQFWNGPKLFMDDYKKRKDVLLGSGALQSRLIDKMLFGSKYQVKEEISKYDYIEIQPLKNFEHIINRGFNIENLKDMIRYVVLEAKAQGKLVVASGDVRYLDEKDKIYHDIYINAKGLGGKRHYLYKFNEKNPVYPKQHFLTTDEMIQELSFLDDITLIKEIVIDNTNRIADLIEDIQVIKDDLYTPKFGDSNKDLTDLVYKNARKKYGAQLPKIIEERIERELTPIIKYGFAVIYWISHLLVGKSLDDGYLVGSRGSVGSSFVATMAEITEVNPLPPHYVCADCQGSVFPEDGSTLNSGYDLPDMMCENCNKPYEKEGQNIPFETFLGFEADKVPDIDLNFSGEYQPIIHNEVKVLFGEKHAFRAGTISTVAEKTAFGYVKSWAEETGKTISKPFVEFIAKGVAGTKRTTGQHPGGIIVIPHEYDVEDFTPINYPANDGNATWKTTHFDFHAIHDNVLKLDLLGHDDPTAIKYLEKLTGVNAKTDIGFSDEKIISLFSSPEALGVKPEDIGGETTGAMGIPEFGTKFVRGMLKNAKVSSFGDLISLSGLSHGTDVWSGNAETLIKERGLTLKEVISCRDNILTDLINKGLDPFLSFNIMEKVRKGKGVSPDEEKAMKEKGVEDWYIDSLKKIKYMFPKAHATAYVMMAWRIAWFKLYHPLAYYATYFTTRSDVFDIETISKGKKAIIEKLADFESRRYKWGSEKLSNKEVDLIPIFELALEAIARGIKFTNIDIEKSQANNWIFDKETNTLIPPFSSLDGLGGAAAISIVEARKDGVFTSIEDLRKRTSINKTHIEKFKEMKILSNLSETNQITLDLFNI